MTVRSQRMNGSLGTILNLLFHCEKTNGRFGTTVKFRISL